MNTLVPHGRAATWRLAALLASLALLTAACAAGSGRYDAVDQAGFLSGIWHGWIAPITLIWQIFDADIRIYEVQNNGFWYDFGFYMAVISGFGGIGLSRRKKKKVVKKVERPR